MEDYSGLSFSPLEINVERPPAACLQAWKHALYYDWASSNSCFTEAVPLAEWLTDLKNRLEMNEAESRQELRNCLGEPTKNTGRIILAEMHSLVPPASILPVSDSSSQSIIDKEDPTSASAASAAFVDVPAGSSNPSDSLGDPSGAANDSTLPLATESPGQATITGLPGATPSPSETTPSAPTTTPVPTPTPNPTSSTVTDPPNGDGAIPTTPPSPGTQPTPTPGTNGLSPGTTIPPDGDGTTTAITGEVSPAMDPSKKPETHEDGPQNTDEDGNPAYDFAKPGDYKPVEVDPGYSEAEVPEEGLPEEGRNVATEQPGGANADGSVEGAAAGEQTTAAGTYVEDRPAQTVMAQSSGGIALFSSASTLATAAVLVAACML